MEQEFSAGRNILDARCSCISLETIEAQVCVDDWTRARYRQQELEQQQQLEQELSYDVPDDQTTDDTTGND